MSANRPTPSKLSSKYKKLVREARKAESPQPDNSVPKVNRIIVNESSEEENDNENLDVSKATSLTSISRRPPRRDSTILAGNITVPETDSEDDSEPILRKASIAFNTRDSDVGPEFQVPIPPAIKPSSKRSPTPRTNKGRGKSVSHATNLVEITEDEDKLLGDELITEDETDFYSCDDNASIQDGSKTNDKVEEAAKSGQSVASQARSLYGETQASSLRLVLSESDSNSMAQYHATPGIVLQSVHHQNIVSDQEKTPTNSPMKTKQARSSTDTDEETDSSAPILNNVNREEIKILKISKESSKRNKTFNYEQVRLKYQQSRVRGSATKSKIIRSDDEMETPPRNSQNTECKVIRSDDELDTPPPTSVSKRNALQSKGLLSESKIDRISSWLSSVSSSDSSRTLQQVSSQTISTEPSGVMKTTMTSKSSTITTNQRTSKLGCDDYQHQIPSAADITEDLSENDMDAIECEPIVQVVQTKNVNRVSSSSEMLSSERTSKAGLSSGRGYSGGSERTSASFAFTSDGSNRTSKAGLSTRPSVDSYGLSSGELTSKGGLSNRPSVDSYGLSSGELTSKGGLSNRYSVDSYGIHSDEIYARSGGIGSSDRTSKAGLSSCDELNAGKMSNRASSEDFVHGFDINNRNSGCFEASGIEKSNLSEDRMSDRTSKAGVSEDILSERTSKAGFSQGVLSDRTSKGELSPEIYSDDINGNENSEFMINDKNRKVIEGSSSNSSPFLSANSGEDKVPSQPDDLTKWRQNFKATNTLSSSQDNSKTVTSSGSGNIDKMDVTGENMIPLADLCNSNATVESTFGGNFVYGNDSVDVSVTRFKEPGTTSTTIKTTMTSSKKSGKKTTNKTEKSAKPKSSNKSAKPIPGDNRTIDNSVDAVRAWTSTIEREIRGTPSTQSEMSVRKEMYREAQHIVISSDDEEDNFDRYLTTLKKGVEKSVNRKNDYEADDDFIVPDDEVDLLESSNSSGTDYSSSPKMSLADKIKDKKSGRRKPNREKSSESESDTSKKPKKKVRDKQVPKDKERSPVLKTKICLDTPDSSPSLIRPRRVGTTTRKNYVIRSDSDSRTSSPSSELPSPRPQSPLVNYKQSPKLSTTKKVVPKSTTSTTKPTQTPKTKTATKPSQKEVLQTPKNKPFLQGPEIIGTPKTLTFLSSLTLDTPSYRCHPEALQYTTSAGYKKKKEELAKRLYHLYNKEVFEGCLPADMEITWNVRLTKTAGLCYSKRYKNKFNVETRSSRIELSAKILDSPDRLRDTLIHEMCHAASWIISGYRDGHGPQWKVWADKSMKRFPELPVVERCHSYQIRTKFSYVCVSCSYTIGRHSKSLDTEKKVCGHCYGRFELVVNAKTTTSKENSSGPGASNNSAPKTPNAFALFTKENYQKFRKPGVEHKDVMAILSQEFRKIKLEEASKQKK